jgi:myo-inositol-1(or 4)-monophosphatase
MNEIIEAAYTTAIDAALEASTHVLTYWPNPLNKKFDKNLIMQIFEKSEGIGNYATIADKESEDLIINKIRGHELLKTHGIIAEESNPSNASSPFQWLIDPIDGTLNFRNGLYDFGISIGLLYNHEPLIGIIAMPAYGNYIAAKKGAGAKLFSFDKKVLLDLQKLEYTQTLDKALIAFDTGYEGRKDQLKETVEKFADSVGYIPCYASASVANCRVALGHVGGYVHATPTNYDIGAAAAIIPEVGGVVTDLQGKPIDWTKNHTSFLAARTPAIHEKLLNFFK